MHSIDEVSKLDKFRIIACLAILLQKTLLFVFPTHSEFQFHLLLICFIFFPSVRSILLFAAIVSATQVFRSPKCYMHSKECGASLCILKDDISAMS